jgi:mannose-6-phosphate isomerase-like protein (cupin superfamily)
MNRLALLSFTALLLGRPNLAAQDAATPTSPHFHPTDERVEVKQGTLLVGMGDRLDLGKTMALATGDTIVAPAGFHHYSIAKGTTVVSVRFIGPYTITYVHSYQAPRQASFPYGY